MDSGELSNQISRALMLVFWLSLPPVVVAAVVGTLFALFQALTQIQEQTLSFAIKLLAVGTTLIVTSRWASSEIYNFTLQLFELLPRLSGP